MFQLRGNTLKVCNKKCLINITERDCREWKLSAINPLDRRTWRSGVRSAMRAASQLSGRGSTDVDVASVPARCRTIVEDFSAEF